MRTQRCAFSELYSWPKDREARSDRSVGIAWLAELEELGYAIGLLSGPRARGPKPKGGWPTLGGRFGRIPTTKMSSNVSSEKLDSESKLEKRSIHLYWTLKKVTR